jgi:hypothetical protein
LAGWIRKRFQEEFGPEYRSLLDAFGETREKVKEALPSYADRKDFYLDLLEGDILGVARRQGKEAVLLELDRQLLLFRKTPQFQKKS